MNFQGSINLKNPKIHIILASIAAADSNFPGNYTGLLHVLGLPRFKTNIWKTYHAYRFKFKVGVHGTNLWLLLSRALVTWVMACTVVPFVRLWERDKWWEILKEWEDRIGIHYLLNSGCDLYFIFNLNQTRITFLILIGERNILSYLL